MERSTWKGKRKNLRMRGWPTGDFPNFSIKKGDSEDLRCCSEKGYMTQGGERVSQRRGKSGTNPAASCARELTISSKEKREKERGKPRAPAGGGGTDIRRGGKNGKSAHLGFHLHCPYKGGRN